MRGPKVLRTFIMFANAIAAYAFRDPPLLLGPVFQPPRHLSTNFGFLATCSQLSSALRNSLEQGQSPFGNFTPNASSVSISMINTAEALPIFSFDFTGSSLNTSAGGTEEVSVDTVFRIGSISKLFTVYAFLLHNGLELWQRPITEYVPELRRLSGRSGQRENLGTVRWEEVTLGSLASHMSGIGRDCEYRSDQGLVIRLTR
jgi:CubicO group peptidase (beta-lactamase class C family)